MWVNHNHLFTHFGIHRTEKLLDILSCHLVIYLHLILNSFCERRVNTTVPSTTSLIAESDPTTHLWPHLCQRGKGSDVRVRHGARNWNSEETTSEGVTRQIKPWKQKESAYCINELDTRCFKIWLKMWPSTHHRCMCNGTRWGLHQDPELFWDPSPSIDAWDLRLHGSERHYCTPDWEERDRK